MVRRRAVGIRADNDNLQPPRLGARRAPLVSLLPMIARRRGGDPASRSEPFRIGAWPLLILCFSGLVLTILCGAFLIELAAVGVLAAGITGCELLRGHFRRRPAVPAIDQQMAG